ncbi:MAG: PEP/pyruvate-binding domain-containing protein [Myxococcota bacterium]
MPVRFQLLELDAIEGAPVGGKAEGLARLRAMGLRVPEAVAVVGLPAKPAASEIEACAGALLARFGSGPLAVRSSAIGEDGAEASFAGQYETVLGVEGEAALVAAIATCLDSAHNARASAYRETRDEAAEEGEPVMSLVAQRMVDARASGVCFTACPVTHRRDRLVIDATRGLGEALVSGAASPDHDEYLRRADRFEPTQCAEEKPVLADGERGAIAREAIHAEGRAGAPLDLEWSIDRDGTLWWLQARPITTLGPDPQALDVAPRCPDDVLTRCNVGEMMPGAVSPLTYSTCAQGIDEGWQRIKDDLWLSRDRHPFEPYLAMSHGHLFINMSAGVRFSSAVTGGTADQQSLALCGRIVPEIVEPPAAPFWQRTPRLLRQVTAMLRPGPRIRRMEALVARGEIAGGESALEAWRAIDLRMDELFEAYQLHLVVSSTAGSLSPILLQILGGGDEPTDAHHAIVAAVLSGASDVESADIALGAERVLEALVADRSSAATFAASPLDAARAWLEGDDSGVAGRRFRDYLERHGHRSLRELDIRQPEWGHDPTPILRSLQTQVRGRLDATDDARIAAPSAVPARPPGAERFDRFRFLAHAAVRNRERTKSLLVAETALFKRAYRALAARLVDEGRLPDPDLVYFFFHEELEALALAAPGDALVEEALGRREALAYQETLRFPEVAVGHPQPEPIDLTGGDDKVVVGKPVSRGRVEGRVRVVKRLEEAESLKPGEILVAPITDVGWTPYFAVIGGLVTDVGSAVSHGAVVAREYGLPAVLNTRNATEILRTGERVVLDGDRGTVERLD